MEAAKALKMAEIRAKRVADAADIAAAELLQEEADTAQAAQRSKQKAAAKKARQKQRKQVLSACCPAWLGSLVESARLPSSRRTSSLWLACCMLGLSPVTAASLSAL